MRSIRVRGVCLVVVIVALGLGWALDRGRLVAQRDRAEGGRLEMLGTANALHQQVQALRIVAAEADATALAEQQSNDRLRAELEGCREGKED